jgi:hypothetical protein
MDDDERLSPHQSGAACWSADCGGGRHVGLKENQRINPLQSKSPRQRVSHHPAEVHACPTVHSAPCTTRYLGLTHGSVADSIFG